MPVTPQGVMKIDDIFGSRAAVYFNALFPFVVFENRNFETQGIIPQISFLLFITMTMDYGNSCGFVLLGEW